MNDIRNFSTFLWNIFPTICDSKYTLDNRVKNTVNNKVTRTVSIGSMNFVIL